MQDLDLDDLDQVSGGMKMHMLGNFRLVIINEKEKKDLVDAELWLSEWGRAHTFNLSDQYEKERCQKINEKVGRKFF